ncbi:hypothetical protein I3J09_25530 [Streptomyces clavuligerus]|nr:hypothetical protein [Streptomyces clavuligerus]AXU15894.1 hypothetical protein D1794_26175 [Streptomyces clavuligerus]MBY6306020.1 hypothetical protein [Streptomyces clavuligerus]QCS08675.1 hypothetical protein CRV15_25545 [Streptomyces clavuligerus]QPJ91990.1 hypothetical protein GE265_02595 [Streptomyces clavuligerus]QPL65885.1 hypothetical protein I3J04_25515 [Streptomyces clavuligerus]
MSDALLSTVTEALAELMTSVSVCDDRVLDRDIADQWLETTSLLLNRLSPADRRTLSGLLRDTARRRPVGEWRDDLLRIPEEFGLDDDPHELYCDAAADLVRRLVKAVRGSDPATELPGRPGRVLADLVREHGALHRRTERLLGPGVPGGVPCGADTGPCAAPRGARCDGCDTPPDDPADRPDWLARGAAAALAALRGADPEAPVPGPGPVRRTRFHSRRLFLETVVGLADAELALGQEPRIPPETGADGIEEYLENLPYDTAAAGRIGGLPDGVLRLDAVDSGAVWTVTVTDGAPGWTATATATGTATAARVRVQGSAGDLLLFVRGRHRPGHPKLRISGDRGFLDRWLAATAR